jgi:hypothetical protein
MPRVKPLVVCCWIAFGLVAAIHWSLDAPGDLANDFYCWATAVTMHDPGVPVKHESASAVTARRVGCRASHPMPIVTAECGFPRAMCGHAIPAIPLSQMDGEISFLVQSWQFSRRTALAPRAPSPCA